MANTAHSANYNTIVDESSGDLTVEDFKAGVESSCFIDYDGYGNPVKDGMIDRNIKVCPSEVEDIPADATHILWYNR